MLMMSSLVSFFYLAGFGKESLLLYFRGQYELTTGYKAMASEIPGGLWEYFAFVIISVFAAYNVIKMSGLRVPAIAFFIISVLTFQYGFVRHDSHSNTAFFFLLVICLAIFGQSNLRSSLTSISMPILVFLMVSQFSMGNLLDATARIQGFTNQLRLADPRYRTQFIQNDLTALQQNAKLNQNMQSLIGESAVAQIPSDQLVGKAFDLNLISPPIPQQYSAYTPWLDETNANFFSGKHAPLFILLSRPTAIDGRNPKWESPLSQIAVLCSYRAETYDDTWLLLKKRSTKICDYENAKQLNKSHSASQEVIKLAKVDIKKTASEKLMTLLFKQLNYDTVTSNGVEWNLVNANNNYLIVNVPDEIDFPSIWSYGKQNQLLAKSNQKISYLILKSE
jgi:hypothetical protein